MEDFVNKNLDEKYTDVYEHDIVTNQDATNMVIEKFLDGHDDDEGRKHQKDKKRWNTQSYY